MPTVSQPSNRTPSATPVASPCLKCNLNSESRQSKAFTVTVNLVKALTVLQSLLILEHIIHIIMNRLSLVFLITLINVMFIFDCYAFKTTFVARNLLNRRNVLSTNHRHLSMKIDTSNGLTVGIVGATGGKYREL